MWDGFKPRALACAIILGAIALGSARAEPDAMHVALAPLDTPMDAAPSTSLSAPFGLTQPNLAAAPAQAMQAKWRNVQSMIAVESRVIEMCRVEADACPASAARFMSIIDEARHATGRAKAGLVNRAINLAIRFSRDVAQFGVTDVWQSPLMTFATGSGDCEDYAIAKYIALREAGISASDLRLVLVHDDRINEDHAVTAARIDGAWLVLDNRTMLLLSDAQASTLKPLMALGDDAPALLRDAGLDARFATAMAG